MGCSRKAMEHCGHSILQKLEENFLVERVEECVQLEMLKRSPYSGKCTHIKMHDLFRDMALHITRKRFMVKAGKELKELPHEEEWSEDLEKVSLMCNSISTIPQTMKCPKFRRLTTLLLAHNSLKEIPNSFFEHFPNLKILDLSRNDFESLPNSLSSLEKLTVLLLTACFHLKSLPSLSKLQALKKLDIDCSGVKEIPEGLEMLLNLKYLNLGGPFKDIPIGLLSKLFRLQYLAIHSILNAEHIRELSKLEVFEGCFSNIGGLNIYAYQRKKLHNYSILVCPRSFLYVPPASSKLVTFESIDFNLGDEIILPHDIRQLHLNSCCGITSLNDIRLRDATDLKVCEVERCDKLESVFSSDCDQLRTLESLKLKHLMNLKVMVAVGAGKSSVGTFSSLKEISLCDCHKIKHLFSGDWVLNNLEVMNVENCRELEEIIINSENQGPGFNNGSIEFIFPRLQNLTLSNLPKLKVICSENGVMVCDSLQFIKIDYCLKIKRIPLYLPQLEIDNEGKLSPSNSLKEIRVYSRHWWESVEWNHPMFNAKNVLKPLLKFKDHRSDEWK
ncbi:hypothetical protein V6N13_087934 [Hibiscus sabdariffa]|uniref:Disease resistance protein At4g27190-like leucine-rich repeats domain-containing protein n=1 Tax=Hibiscus sabdariffa TaxID=183260 RepID=A0ABR2FXR1_9ROSI